MMYTPNRSGPTLQGAELGVCSTAAPHRLTAVDIQGVTLKMWIILAIFCYINPAVDFTN